MFWIVFWTIFALSKFLYRILNIKRNSSLTITELITIRGFVAEEHVIKTTDGYYLKIHRLYDARFSAKVRRDRTIAVFHGMAANSAHFVINSKLDRTVPNNKLADEYDDSLAHSLALRGYDVWLTNVRGNFFTLKHEQMRFTDSAFWDFGLDEMIEHDVPALFDYILEQTGSGKQIFRWLLPEGIT